MSDADERLRSLERRWRETGAVADEARWLSERVRLGFTSEAALELAARLGYRAAREARAETTPALESLVEWSRAITRFKSEELSRRTVLASVKLVLPIAARFPHEGVQEAVAHAARLIASYTSASAELRAECRALGEGPLFRTSHYPAGPAHLLSPALSLPIPRAQLATLKATETVRLALLAVSLAGVQASHPDFSDPHSLVSGALDGTSAALAYADDCPFPSRPHEERLKAAILFEIVPWLLDLVTTA
jgi:hypothetical protein